MQYWAPAEKSGLDIYSVSMYCKHTYPSMNILSPNILQYDAILKKKPMNLNWVQQCDLPFPYAQSYTLKSLITCNWFDFSWEWVRWETLSKIQGADFKLSPVPGGSHMHLTGQNEVSLEPHSPHKDFEISHAQIGHF